MPVIQDQGRHAGAMPIVQVEAAAWESWLANTSVALRDWLTLCDLDVLQGDVCVCPDEVVHRFCVVVIA